jgi:hypothetical protein
VRSRLVGLVALALHCSPTPLDVGSAAAPSSTSDARSPPAPAVDAASAVTLDAQLRAVCAAASGPADRYDSAAQLTSRLTGRWFACYAAADAPLESGAGFSFDGAGHWSMLDWNAGHDGFVEATDSVRSGAVRFLAFADADAGAGASDGGTSSQFVALDDPTPRGGLFVYLDRDSASSIVEQIDFEREPRKMDLREAGPRGSAGYLVPVP